jgi:zinc transporter ZupT
MSSALAMALVATGAGALGGGIVAADRLARRHLPVLVSFAAGGFLAAAAQHLIPESVAAVGYGTGLLAVAIGLALFAVIGRIAGPPCPSCGHSHRDAAATRLSPILIGALALHSLLDGVALAGPGETTANALLALVIAAHKVTEGMALAAIIVAAGQSRWAAALITAGVAAMTLVGAAIALFGPAVSTAALGTGIGIAAGSLIYFAGLSLWIGYRERLARRGLVAAGIGFAAIFLAGLLVPH